MVKAEQISTSDLVILVRRHLGVGDSTTGDYSSDRVISALNRAQAWVRQKLFRNKMYWLSRKSEPITLTSSQTKLMFPDDFWWERRLLKQTQVTPPKFEACGITRPENAEGHWNQGDGREWWVVQDGYFEYEGQPEMFEGGVYVIDYYWLAKALSDSAGDISELPSETHQIIALRGAYYLGREMGMFDRIKVLQEELIEWEGSLEAEAGRLAATRPQVLQPKLLRHGTLGWATEQVCQVFMSRSIDKTPDFWTDARVRPEVQNAVWWFQLEALNFHQSFYTKKYKATPNHNQIRLPEDFMEEVRFSQLPADGSGDGVPVEIVSLSGAQVAGISALGYGVYPSSTVSGMANWSINGNQLEANTSEDLSNEYELLYEALLPEMDAPEDPIMIPKEYLEIVVDRAIETVGQKYGQTPIALEFREKYRNTLREKAKNALAIRARSQRRGVRDGMGYGLEQFNSMDGP